MPRVFVAVGSNLGDRAANFRKARELLIETGGVRGLISSGIRETEPVGGPPQGKFLNAVWDLRTDMPPGVFFDCLAGIEKSMGRVRTEKNGPRTIDLDLLFYGDAVIREAGLTVPHPRLHERLFVLEPFCELAPEWVHPVLRRPLGEILEALRANHRKSGEASGPA